MRLYRDMTPAEREVADRLFENSLLWQKQAAEDIMEYHDSLDPDQRRQAREEEFDYQY